MGEILREEERRGGEEMKDEEMRGCHQTEEVRGNYFTRKGGRERRNVNHFFQPRDHFFFKQENSASGPG